MPTGGTDVDTGSELARAGGAGSGLSAGSGSIGPAGAETAGVGAGVGGAGAGGSGASAHPIGATNAAAGRGMAGGMLPPMMGAGLGGDNPTESTTWLSEDEDIWGTGEGDHAPAVLGENSSSRCRLAQTAALPATPALPGGVDCGR